MPKTGTEGSILAALEAAAPAHGVDIVDVDIVGATKAPCVRVRIDHADESLPVISLDEVSEQTGWISDAIDALDPFPGSFTLEVSSPGLDRPLRRAHDFERFAGQTVVLTTTATEGRRKFTGELKGLDEAGACVLIACEGEPEPAAIPLDQVKKCTIKPDFSASSKPSK